MRFLISHKDYIDGVQLANQSCAVANCVNRALPADLFSCVSYTHDYMTVVVAQRGSNIIKNTYKVVENVAKEFDSGEDVRGRSFHILCWRYHVPDNTRDYNRKPNAASVYELIESLGAESSMETSDAEVVS